MIVVDSNILAYLFIPDAGFEDAEALLKVESEWAAPLLWRSEFRNILALYLRKRLLSFDQLLQIQEAAETLLAGNEYELPSTQVLELVRDSACSAYDCEFVALAHHLKVPLVTQDKKVLAEFPAVAVSMGDFLDGR